MPGVAWKKVVTASGTAGQLLGIDLTGLNAGSGTNGLDPLEHQILTADASGQTTWEDPYLHPPHPIQTPSITAAAGAANELIDTFAFAWNSNAYGHILSSSIGAPTVRALDMNDFGYYGTSNANYYQHPNSYTAATLTVAATATAADAEVITDFRFGFSVDNHGHISSFDTTQPTALKESIDLRDLGYMGDLSADRFEKWKIVADNGQSADISTEEAVGFQGGGNIRLDFDGTTLTVYGEADALGEILSITEGDGISISGGGTANGANPNVTVALVTPETSGDPSDGSTTSSVGKNDANGNAGGHMHMIEVTSDGAANPGTLLVVPASGLVTLQDLETMGDFTVQGDHAYFDTVDIAFADNVIQINTDAVGTAYNDSDSGTLFGNSTLDHGAKLINTDASFILSGLHAVDDDPALNPGGSLTIGAPKPLECQHIAVGEAYVGRLYAQNNVIVDGGVEVSDYVRLNANESEAPGEGSLRFSGGKLWVNI